MEKFTIEQGDHSKLNEQDINRLFEIMRHAYAVTEVEVWGENYTRMPLEEFLSIIDKGQLFVARIDGRVVGSIQTYPLREGVYAFGLLSADFAERGKGIGRALIQRAENHARYNEAHTMSLEILRPSELEVPFKTVLKNWYEKQGYVFKESQLFEIRKPHKAKKALNLIRPCVFDIYEKPL